MVSFVVTHTWHHAAPKPGRKPSIWEALAAKLGREPTNEEACAEVRRILTDGLVEMAEAGQAAASTGQNPGLGGPFPAGGIGVTPRPQTRL